MVTVTSCYMEPGAMAKNPPKRPQPISLREAMLLLRRIAESLTQIKAGEWDGCSPGVRAQLSEMLEKVQALVDRDPIRTGRRAPRE